MPATIVVPAAAVSTFRELAYRDYSTFAERLPRCQHPEDFEDHYEMVEEAAQLMAALGWDEASEGDCTLVVEEDFIRGLLVGTFEEAMASCEGGRSARERLEALRQVQCCVQVWAALEGVSA